MSALSLELVNAPLEAVPAELATAASGPVEADDALSD